MLRARKEVERRVDVRCKAGVWWIERKVKSVRVKV
jgi:hypothetical protein